MRASSDAFDLDISCHQAPREVQLTFLCMKKEVAKHGDSRLISCYEISEEG